MVRTCFYESFASDFHIVSIELNFIIEYLRREIPNLTDDILFDLRIIYNELMSNAIIHGNHHDKSKKIELFIEIDGKSIISTIKDEGIGFDYSGLLKTPRIPASSLMEHGRGLRMVVALADFVAWNDIGNEVIFHKNL